MAEIAISCSDLYPSIDPSSFDLIVVGTGLPESIFAAAAASAKPRKSVLHLDPNPFYGSHFASLSIGEFSSALTCPPPDTTFDSLKPRRLYSHVELSKEDAIDKDSRSFALDLAGPRLLFCADPMVDLLIKSGASNYVEFKSVDASFLFQDGQLWLVPDSRQGVFMDETLKLTERTRLSMFFKLVQEHFASEGDGNVQKEGKRISEEDLEIPFVEFLQKQKLPPKIKEMFLYAIAMADYDQESPEICKNLIKTRDGMNSLSLYTKSVGRFPNASGAFIYPIYGQGELPQAFCRCAAVQGALYVLRMPVTGLLLDEENGQCRGVRLASGQNIFSHQLLLDSSFFASPLPFPVPESQHEDSNQVDASEPLVPVQKVIRAIYITRCSIKPDLSNMLVVFPPKSLYDGQATSIRALQLGSNLAVCPTGLFVLYLSTLSDDPIEGKKSLREAVNTLFMVPASENYENNNSLENESVKAEPEERILWSAMYAQDLVEGSFGVVSLCPIPDGNLDFRDLLGFTMKLFNRMYPQDEFFPEKQRNTDEVDKIYPQEEFSPEMHGNTDEKDTLD